MSAKYEEEDRKVKDEDLIGMSSSDSEDDGVSDRIPNEAMMMPPGWQQSMPDIWLAKIPISLMQRWAAVEQPGVPLAIMRVYKDAPKPIPAGGQDMHKITIHIPQDAQYPTDGLSQMYKFVVPKDPPENKYVFADQAKTPEDGEPPVKRARLSRLTGRVAHSGHFVSKMTDQYSAQIGLRNKAANVRSRGTIKLLPKKDGDLTPDSEGGERANYKLLQSGSGAQGGVGLNLAKQKSKQDNQKFARMAQNELLDRLQELFRQKDVWSIKDLRTQTEQPEAWLRKTLAKIAIMPRNGPNANNWLLNSSQKGILEKEREAAALASGSGVKGEGGVKGEIEDEDMEDVEGADEDEEDDDDDDLEEIE